MALLVSCSTVPPSNAEDDLCSFVDDMGSRTYVPRTLENVAVLFSSLADMWTLAGGTVAVTVGESVERGIVSHDVLLVDDGAGKSISAETLISAAPDFVIGSADVAAHRALAPILERAGIPFALFRVDTFSDYARVMAVFCEITARVDQYEVAVTSVKTEVDDILSRTPTEETPPRVLFVRVGSGYSATKAKRTEEHFVCAMLAELGAVNLADAAPALTEGLNVEAILDMDPDFIFLSPMGKESAAKAYMDSLLSSDAWQSLAAVSMGNYAYLDKNLFQYKPCDDWAEAYAVLYEHLYGTPAER